MDQKELQQIIEKARFDSNIRTKDFISNLEAILKHLQSFAKYEGPWDIGREKQVGDLLMALKNKLETNHRFLFVTQLFDDYLKMPITGGPKDGRRRKAYQFINTLVKEETLALLDYIVHVESSIIHIQERLSELQREAKDYSQKKVNDWMGKLDELLDDLSGRRKLERMGEDMQVFMEQIKIPGISWTHVENDKVDIETTISELEKMLEMALKKIAEQQDSATKNVQTASEVLLSIRKHAKTEVSKFKEMLEGIKSTLKSVKESREELVKLLQQPNQSPSIELYSEQKQQILPSSSILPKEQQQSPLQEKEKSVKKSQEELSKLEEKLQKLVKDIENYRRSWSHMWRKIFSIITLGVYSYDKGEKSLSRSQENIMKSLGTLQPKKTSSYEIDSQTRQTGTTKEICDKFVDEIEQDLKKNYPG